MHANNASDISLLVKPSNQRIRRLLPSLPPLAFSTTSLRTAEIVATCSACLLLAAPGLEMVLRNPLLFVTTSTGSGDADWRADCLFSAAGRHWLASFLSLWEERDEGEVSKATEESCCDQIRRDAIRKRSFTSIFGVMRDVHLIVEDRYFRFDNGYYTIIGRYTIDFILNSGC